RDAGELVVGELIAVFADQHAEDVVARLAPRTRDQRGHVCSSLLLQYQPFGYRNGQVQLPRAAPLEVLAVVVGHTEQFADHQRRNRQRKVLHQICWRALAFHRVQLRVDDLGDARLEALDTPDGELGCQQAAKPRVVGRVEAEQVARTRGGRFLFG